jgi:peptide/nickel transport system substrate-binding protein
MAAELFFAPSQVLDTFIPPGHPLADKQARRYTFDPQAGAAALETAGWLDADHDPATPRTALGVPGVPDGTPFEFTYLMAASNLAASSLGERAADIVRSSLAQCGVKVTVQLSDGNSLFAPGPQGPVFGRQFDMAQFAWSASLFPPCYLYESGEIPGPTPEFPKGWGGANASGYRSPEFDQACQAARLSIPDAPAFTQAVQQAQEIFAEDLPALPLYLHLRLVAFRPDLCHVAVDPTAESALWNIEMFTEGSCSP